MLWLENDPTVKSSETSSHNAVGNEITLTLPKCDSVLRRYTFFNFVFLLVCVLEIILISYYSQILSSTSLLSIAITGIFITVFAYFLLRVYWQTSKNQKLTQIKNNLIQSLRSAINYQNEHVESHVAMSQALCRLAESFKGREHTVYRSTKRPATLAHALEKICFWIHWQDFHFLREKILEAAVEEQIKRVKCEPTDPEAHASLANTYILLSSLYGPSGTSEEENGFWDPIKKERVLMERKFRNAAEKAIEELKILSIYAPNDPWIHEQLAYSYKDLQMPEEEIREYEQVLRLMPNDTEILYKLGVLYFQQGKNVNGLHLYEQLKQYHPSKAELLIQYYGAYKL
jgi:tetratricopeptide (TPR) repeat protein